MAQAQDALRFTPTEEAITVGGPFYEHELSGRYLQEAFFGPGARDDWKTTVLRATGEELNPDYFVKSL